MVQTSQRNYRDGPIAISLRPHEAHFWTVVFIVCELGDVGEAKRARTRLIPILEKYRKSKCENLKVLKEIIRYVRRHKMVRRSVVLRLLYEQLRLRRRNRFGRRRLLEFWGRRRNVFPAWRRPSLQHMLNLQIRRMALLERRVTFLEG